MVHFQAMTSFPAGGEGFLVHIARKIGRRAGRSGPGTRERAVVPIADALAEYFDLHMNTSCGDGVVKVSLDEPSTSRWAALCSAAAAASMSWSTPCARMMSMGAAWPSAHSGAEMARYDFNARVTMERTREP